MNLDRTFCQGLRCDRKELCDRWTGHLRAWLEKNPDYKARAFSMAQFADHDGKCMKFSAIESATEEKGSAK